MHIIIVVVGPIDKMIVLINSKALLCKNSYVLHRVPCASKTGDLSHYMQA